MLTEGGALDSWNFSMVPWPMRAGLGGIAHSGIDCRYLEFNMQAGWESRCSARRIRSEHYSQAITPRLSSAAPDVVSSHFLKIATLYEPGSR